MMPQNIAGVSTTPHKPTLLYAIGAVVLALGLYHVTIGRRRR